MLLSPLVGFPTKKTAELRAESGGKILVAAVGEDGDDFASRLDFAAFGEFDDGRDVCAAGDADGEAVTLDEVAGGCDSVGGFDADDVIEEAQVEDFWDESGADALDAVRAGLDGLVVKLLADNGRGCGLNGDGLDRLGELLEVFGQTGDGAAGADACDDEIDVVTEDFGDFGCSCLEMRADVGGVRELEWQEVFARIFVDETLCFGDGAFHAGAARGEDEFGTVDGDELAALDAHGVGHHDFNRNTEAGADRCKANARVAAGRLDNRDIAGTGFEDTALNGILNHVPRDTVFDAAGRICALLLDIDIRANEFGYANQACQRCVSQTLNVTILRHFFDSPPRCNARRYGFDREAHN